MNFQAALVLLLCSLSLGGCSKSVVRQANLLPSDLDVAETMPEDEGKKLDNLPTPVLLQQGREYMASGNLQLARLHFLMALKKEPGSAAACAGFGDVQTQAGDLEKAETAYQAALSRLPGYLPALLGLGRVRRGSGNTDGALQSLEEARQAHPENPEVLSELAITLDDAGRAEEAGHLHRQAAERRPDSSSAANNLGFHYLLQERYPEAISALKKALKLNPQNMLARNNLAVACVLSGDTETALGLFRESIGEAAAWNNIGYLFMTRGKRELAEKAFRRALDLNPKFYGVAKRNLDNLGQKDNPILR